MVVCVVRLVQVLLSGLNSSLVGLETEEEHGALEARLTQESHSE